MREKPITQKFSHLGQVVHCSTLYIMKHGRIKHSPAEIFSSQETLNDSKPKKSIWKTVFGKKQKKPTLETIKKITPPKLQEETIDYRASFDSQVLPFIQRQSTVLSKSERRSVVESKTRHLCQDKKIGIEFNQLIHNIFGEIPWETNQSWTAFRHPLQLSNSEAELIESLPKQTPIRTKSPSVRRTVTQKLSKIFHHDVETL
jgi:hypothetical protein